MKKNINKTQWKSEKIVCLGMKVGRGGVHLLGLHTFKVQKKDKERQNQIVFIITVLSNIKKYFQTFPGLQPEETLQTIYK